MTLSNSQRNRHYDLSITADENGSKYLYSGVQQPTDSYALTYNPQSQTFTLDQISTEFTFNLRSTPTTKSSKELAAQYPHLDTGVSDPESNSDDLFEEEQFGEADASNPYDYRHFLKRRCTSSPEPLPSTPLPPPSPPRRAVSRPKPKPRPRPQQKRAPTPPPREEADADNEDSDDGILTIEMDPDTKPRRIAAFNHDIRDGPISLRSAASSVSPAPVAIESSESDEDMDDDEQKPESAGVIVQTPGEHEDEEEEEEEEEDQVEHDEDDDIEGSLEAELEIALESQADEEESGGVQIVGNGLGITGVQQNVGISRVMDESSSESEEE